MGNDSFLVMVMLLVLSSIWVVMCLADTGSNCSLSETKSPLLRLKKHLFCEYDSTVRPVMKKDTVVNVSVTLSPMLMNFIDESSTFILHTWVKLDWKDEHLTWMPEDFDGVTETRVKSTEIWIPDFSIYNSGDMTNTQEGIPSTMCPLEHTGKIFCVPAIKYTTRCDADFTYWPYDKQTCSLHMGSWTHTGEEINFDFKNSSIDMTNYYTNYEWKITNYTTEKETTKYNCCPHQTYITLILDFEMQRHPSMVHIVFITPVFVLMIITMTILWLDSRSIERMLLAAVNVICHLLCINDLHYMVPANGAAGSPRILLFYRDSLVVATFALILTTFLRKVQSIKITPPSWILNGLSFLSKHRISRFLLLYGSSNNFGDAKQLVSNASCSSDRDDIEENAEFSGDYNFSTVNESSANETWRKIAMIIERLALIMVSFTYLLLLILLVPRG